MNSGGDDDDDNDNDDVDDDIYIMMKYVFVCDCQECINLKSPRCMVFKS